MNPEQWKVIRVIEDQLELDFQNRAVQKNSANPIFMFITGEGGTGKSFIISIIEEMFRERFGKTRGDWGVCLLIAPTGNAAHNIGGSTWQSKLGKGVLGSNTNKDGSRKKISTNVVNNLVARSRGCRIVILDEGSLISLQTLSELDQRFRAATGNADAIFGGLHFIICGDFYQMKSIGGTSIPEGVLNKSRPYPRAMTREAEAGYNVFSKLTHYYELKINVRAATTGEGKSDLATFNTAARLNQMATPEVAALLTKFNTNVGINEQDLYDKTDRDTIYLTDTHTKINKINKFYLNKLLQTEGNVLVTCIADHKPYSNSMPIDRGVLDYLYHQTDSIGAPVDVLPTYIELTIGTRVRITYNLGVELGLYNGRMGTVYGFIWNRKQIIDTSGGSDTATNDKKKFCDMTQEEREIPIVLVKLEDDSKYKLTTNNVVPIVAVEGITKIKMGAHNRYTRRQLPLLPAHARTTHATQGITAMKDIIVDVCNQFYGGLYVAISRAKELPKIFLTRALAPRHFAVGDKFRQVVHQFYEIISDWFPSTTPP
jgi:ATP-dependent exoDNAse (exonuclease V) alpha subunit